MFPLRRSDVEQTYLPVVAAMRLLVPLRVCAPDHPRAPCRRLAALPVCLKKQDDGFVGQACGRHPSSAGHQSLVADRRQV